MKPLIASLIMCFTLSAAAAAGPITSRDKGWMAFFTGDMCQMGRRTDDDSVQGRPGSGIAIAILRNPHDKMPPAVGQTMLSVSLFKDDTPQNEPVHSVTIAAGSKQWKLTSADYGVSYLTGQAADDVRSLFLSDGVTVQVLQPDGNSQSFVVSSRGFKVANATFNACVAELLLNKPLQPTAQ